MLISGALFVRAGGQKMRRTRKAQTLRFAIILGWIAIAILACMYVDGSPQLVVPPSGKLNRVQLQQDFAILRKSLEEGHAGLYRYTSKEDMDAAFETAMATIDRDMTVLEFSAIVTSLADAIECGHTQFVMPGAFKKSLQQTAKQFPLRLKFLSRKAYVMASSDRQIPEGSELLSVNDMPIGSIATAIMRHLPGDGDIKTGKYKALDAAFGWLYFLYVARPDFFTVEYLDASGRVHHAKLPAVNGKEIPQSPQNPVPDLSNDLPWKYELLPLAHSARLTIKTFASPDEADDGLKFAQFLESSFDKAAKAQIEDLVIDLRGNDGGEDYGPALYSYIADQDFEVYSSIESSTDKLPFISQYSKVGVDFIAKFRSQLTPANDRRFRITKESGFSFPTQHPRPNNYRNRVWVLTDGDVFSSGTVFCSLVKSHKRAVFVGEETGGAYQGFNAGELVVITLPTSQLRVVIPLLSFRMATGPIESPRRGILPDQTANYSIKDVIDGKDLELELVAKLIQQKRSGSGNSRTFSTPDELGHRAHGFGAQVLVQ
jgi:hypothetical protein